VLHFAANSAVLLLLLQHGVEAWQLNGAGETALAAAVARECWEAAKVLLETPGAVDGIKVCCATCSRPSARRECAFFTVTKYDLYGVLANQVTISQGCIRTFLRNLTCTPAPMQVRGRDGWTCFHHALSLPSRGPDAEAWIRDAAALPSRTALLAEAEKDVAALAADGEQLEAAAGVAGNGGQVRRGWRAGEMTGFGISRLAGGWDG
jgi:hypothetical protein